MEVKAQIKENGYEIRVSEIKLYHHLGMSPSRDYAFFFKIVRKGGGGFKLIQIS